MFGCVMAALMMGGAQAQDPEELIVYGDDFARWEETRWMVEAEIMVPLGLVFSRDERDSFQSFAFQIRAVVACNKDYESKKARPKRLDVTCDVEDIAMLTTSQRRWKREQDRELVQRVLDEVDAKLTGTRVQLQVDHKGGVNNVDIEGIVTQNARERTMAETLRQVTLRLLAGFHLKIPDHAQRAGQWIEYNSELMEVPSLTSSRGSSTLVHQVSPYKAYQLVQSLGEGTISSSIPAPRQENLRTSPDDGSVGTVARPTENGGAGGGGIPSMNGAREGAALNSSGTVLSIDMTYTLAATGVALFERETGIMTERVWSVEGRPTASSAGGALINTVPFRNVGKLRILDADENPNLGPSQQVALPGVAIEGLPPWRPISVTPGSEG